MTDQPRSTLAPGTTVTIINTPDLVYLNSQAIRTHRNRCLRDDIGDLLDPDGIHLVPRQMLHNDVEIRLMLMLKMRDEAEPVTATLDVSFEHAAALPKIRLSADGTWERV